MQTTKAFLDSLRQEVLNHPTVKHAFLDRVANNTLPKKAFLEFGLQLYPHCHFFIAYMEQLLLNGPDSRSKLCVAKILLDEYGEDAGGKDHPKMFRDFLNAAGASDRQIMEAPLDPAIIALVRAHLELCAQSPFLIGLGAIGPGHELPIPAMFSKISQGMKRAGFSDKDILFFTLHTDHDVEHANMMEEAIAQLADTEEKRAQVRHGAITSLDARGRFWEAVDKRMQGNVSAGADRPVTLSQFVAEVTSSMHLRV